MTNNICKLKVNVLCQTEFEQVDFWRTVNRRRHYAFDITQTQIENIFVTLYERSHFLLTFWHRSFTFKFQHTLYVKCE